MNTHASLGMHKMFDKFDIDVKVYAVINFIGTALSSTKQLVKTWVKNSNGRRELARLDARMLRDIGLDAHQVQHEINKRFWRA